VSKIDVKKVFEAITNDPHDEGLLDRYINKTRKYMIEKGFPEFEINKSVTSWAKLSRPAGQVLRRKDSTGYEWAIIQYSKGKNDLETRAVVAHELGHIALHFDELPAARDEPSKQKQATEFAKFVLMDRSKRYNKLKEKSYVEENYAVAEKNIDAVLERLFRELSLPKTTIT
jgi:hypothetical protein